VGGRQDLLQSHITAWTLGHSVQPILHPLALNLPKWGSVAAMVKRTMGEHACTSKSPMSVLVLVKYTVFCSDAKSSENKKHKIQLTSGKGFIASKCLSTEGFLLQLCSLLTDGHNKQETIFSCPAIIKIAMLGYCQHNCGF